MDDTFLFVVVIIVAIIIAILLAYTTSRDTDKGGFDQRNSSDVSDLSDFGSGHHGTGQTTRITTIRNSAAVHDRVPCLPCKDAFRGY
jgi:hypothetical protein